MDALEQLAVPLLEWFRDNARPLPWRDDPTPYHVWLSEIMLQQTRVAAVLDYYNRFLRQAPDIPALAALPEERLMKLWQGLGYYSRARNLQRAAKIIVEEYGGAFPSDYAAVRALPGPSAPSPWGRRCPPWTAMSCGYTPGSAGTAGTSPPPR